MRTEALRRIAIAGASLTLALFSSTNASAFCRTTTSPAPSDYDPVSGGGCRSEGIPLFYRSQCLPYRVPAKDSPKISSADLSSKLAKAFATWTAANSHCTPGITGIELAPSSATTIVEYRSSGANENLIGVPETWHYSGEVLAMPTAHFNATTGEIYDVDLEINPLVEWSVGDTPPPNGYDLEAVITHGVGHMLGIDHSDVAGSAMSGRYDVGTTSQRSLDDDDEQAICAIYPNRAQRGTAGGLTSSTACDLAPGSGCEADISHGCSTNPTGTSGKASGVIAPLFALVGLSRLSRRRRD